jgi:hypothetical protein
MPISTADRATLSLLDPDQAVCPNGHPCRLDQRVGYRRCGMCDYRGLALVCWEITESELGRAIRRGADPTVAAWAQSFLRDRLAN